jgi:hypothetical protein
MALLDAIVVSQRPCAGTACEEWLFTASARREFEETPVEFENRAESRIMAATHTIVPLHLSGNTTEQQNQQLQSCLGDAVHSAYLTAIEQLDKQSAQAVLEAERQVKADIANAVTEIVHSHTISSKYEEEEVGSDRGYPSTYCVRPVEAQVTELRKAFPALDACQEKLGRVPLPEGAEAWFAIPRWEAVASTYNEAVENILEVLAKKRRISNRIAGRLGEKYLRQIERSRLAETILAEQQEGNDILVVAAQGGMLHRGSSARRTRASLAGNEFCLGVFAVASILITHTERLSAGDSLMIDCGGDQYSPRADYTFDRVPLFDFDISGIEFSVFYEDRARNQWGTPTGFLYTLA